VHAHITQKDVDALIFALKEITSIPREKQATESDSDYLK
jgi:hypothetical protein